MAERGLASIIHERLWAHLVAAVGDDPEILVRDAEPYRELRLGRYRVRCKRHDEWSRIATYLTPEAREFWSGGNGQLPLPGLGEISLAVGYRWLREERNIGAPVISYREGVENPVWAVELGTAASGPTPFTWSPIIGPTLPQIDLYEGSDIGAEQEESP